VEEEMEEKTNSERTHVLETGVVVDVVVGGFELKLGEVLGLRPGAEVFFPCGHEIRGTARVAGGAIATVVVAFEPGGFVARVLDLSPLVERGGDGGNSRAICPIQTEEPRRVPRIVGGGAVVVDAQRTLVEEL